MSVNKVMKSLLGLPEPTPAVLPYLVPRPPAPDFIPASVPNQAEQKRFASMLEDSRFPPAQVETEEYLVGEIQKLTQRLEKIRADKEATRKLVATLAESAIIPPIEKV